MTDMPTLANGGAPASPSPAPTPPAAAPASATPPASTPRPSAPENPRARGHSPARDYREAAAARAAGEAPGEAPPAGDQPQPAAADAGTKVRVGEFEVSPEELSAMMRRQAVEDQRRLTMPTKPEEYKAELPADLKLPGGQQYKFDVNDPSLVAARNLAHAKGWSQQDFSEALGIFAGHHAAQEAALAERSRAEILKAGVTAPQRVDAVGKWITAEMGEADAKPIRATIVTDAHLRFYEKLMQKIETQGVGRFSQSHRASPDDQKIPGYEKMSFEQKRFAQETIAARTRR